MHGTVNHLQRSATLTLLQTHPLYARLDSVDGCIGHGSKRTRYASSNQMLPAGQVIDLLVRKQSVLEPLVHCKVDRLVRGYVVMVVVAIRLVTLTIKKHRSRTCSFLK